MNFQSVKGKVPFEGFRNVSDNAHDQSQICTIVLEGIRFQGLLFAQGNEFESLNETFPRDPSEEGLRNEKNMAER